MNYGFSPTALPVESSGTSDEGGGEKKSNTVKCGMLAKRLFQKAAHRHHLVLDPAFHLLTSICSFLGRIVFEIFCVSASSRKAAGAAVAR